MSEEYAGAPGLCGLNRRMVGCIITHQPPEMAREGGGGTQESKAHSGTVMSAVSQGLEAPAGRVLGKWAGWGEPGGQRGRCHQFQFCQWLA